MVLQCNKMKLSLERDTERKDALDIERYATLHKEHHNFLEGLKEYGYAGMDEGSKTRHLLAGIKTTELDSVKHRSYAMLSSGKILPNVWSYSRTTSCKPRLTSPKSSIFHQLPPSGQSIG